MSKHALPADRYPYDKLPMVANGRGVVLSSGVSWGTWISRANRRKAGVFPRPAHRRFGDVPQCLCDEYDEVYPRPDCPANHYREDRGA